MKKTVVVGGGVKSSTLKTAGNKLNDSGVLMREDFDGGPISLDEIIKGLYLGNLMAATNMETLKTFKILHILTLDSVPLPKHIVEIPFLNTKYIQISDMPKEDILHHLENCVNFISEALDKQENVLVHCYFGVSRSSSIVIAYVMKQHQMDYQAAFEFVKSKRRFVQPNPGFISQLRLYGRMGCKIDAQYQKYKIYRLRLAGEQVRKVKILPQNFNNLIKSDPAITQENPEPIVYRCRKCRRVVATQSHLLLHPRKSNLTANCRLNHIKTNKTTEKIENLTARETTTSVSFKDQSATSYHQLDRAGPAEEQEESAVNLGKDVEEVCKSILFVEPIAWMKQVFNNEQGRLNCPKCEQKLGNFSWINACQCPCGEEISPAFYLIPSKVELSKAVQNVQTTV